MDYQTKSDMNMILVREEFPSRDWIVPTTMRDENRQLPEL